MASNNIIQTENGIFPSQKTNEFVCMICPKTTTFVDWQKHIESLCHIGTLRSFKRTFKSHNSCLICECGQEIEWKTLKDHATWHSIVPWYEPKSRYKKFFENHFQECDSSFNCNLCDVIFPEWSTAWVHTGEKTHINLVEAALKIREDSKEFSSIESVYETLVAEGFALWSATTVRCRVCNLVDVRLRDIFSHIRTPQHSLALQKFTEILRARIKEEFYDSPDESMKKIESAESTIDFYVVKEKDNEYCCKLCRLKIIGHESVNVHAMGICHTMTLRNYGCEKIKRLDNGAWCEYCESPIGEMADVCRHVMSKNHACAVSKMRDRSMIDPGTPSNSKKSDVIPSTSKNSALRSNFITKVIDGNFYCKICNTLLYEIELVDIHINSKIHESNAKRYGCDNNITLTKDYKLYCLCCDHDISELKDIYSHTVSDEHKNLAEKKNTREISQEIKEIEKNESKEMTEIAEEVKEIEKNESKEITEIAQEVKEIEKNESTEIPEISFWYIEKLTDTKYYCYICLTSLPDRRAIEEHISSEKHTFEFTQHSADAIIQKNDTFYCKTCNIELETRTFIIAHVKSAHVPKLSEKQNEKSKQEIERSDKDSIADCKGVSVGASGDDKSKKSISNSLLAYGADIYISSKGRNEYWCECCQCEIPTRENIFGHTSTSRHKSSARLMNPNAPALSLTPHSACMYIVNLNGSEYHCKVCDLLLSGQISVNEHAVSEEHIAGLYRDGCLNISHTHGKLYHCKSCKCEISTLPNVYLHIKGTRHRESMSARGRTNIKCRSESLNDVSSKSNSLFRYGGDNYITQKNAKEYWCESCQTVIPSLENIFGHTSSSRHKSSIIGVKTNCIPRPDALSANLSCIYIAKLGGSAYHCEVCDVMLSGNAMANDHAASEQHIASLKRYSCSNIVLQDGIDYYCNSCKCKVPGIANVYLHVRGPRHRDSSRNYSSTNENAGRPDSTNENAGRPASTNENAVRPDSTNQRYRERSTDHAQNTRSSSLCRNTGDPYVESIRGNKYYCRCCDCNIPTFENIYVHITGIKHKNLAKNLGDQSTAGPTPFCCYIVKFNDKNYICKVCNISMYDQKTVEDHAKGELHANARKRYGCDQIRPNIDNYTYYCRSCNCKIPNLANVYVHINGMRHIEGLPIARHSGKAEATVSNGSTTKPEVAKVSGNATKPEVAGTSGNTTKPEISIKSKNDTDIVSLQTKRGENYIVSEGIADFLCKICGISIIGLANVDAHLASQTHANAREEYGCDNITKSVMNKYNCRCCDCEVPNLENVHRHVKGHRHMMIVAKQRQIANNNVNIDNSEAAKKNIEEKTNGQKKIGKNDENINEKRKSVEKIEVSQNSPGLSSNSVNGAKSIEKIGSVESLASNTSRTDLTRLEMLKKNSNGERKLRTPKRPNTEKKIEFDDYDNCRIYELNDMWKDVKIGLQTCMPVHEDCVYCLICRETVDSNMTNYFEHLRNPNHDKKLKEMLNYDATFEGVGELSDYGLALQFMEEIDENEIHCHVCRDFIENDEIVIQKHLLDENHAQECRDKRNEAQGIYEAMKEAKNCDWYNVHLYRCEPCGANFFNQLGLSKHLKSNGHTSFVNDKEMIYDHCSRCSILWYGPSDTYSKFHRRTPKHMWIFDCEESSPDLPKLAKIMLANFIDYVLTGTSYSDIEKETRKNEIVIGDLEKIVKSEFPQAKAHIYGSRGCLVNTTHSDIDLFLDSGDMYEGNASSNDRKEFIARVEKCLREESRTWELSLAPKSPTKFSVIKAYHRETGLYCNLSFDNGLCVESAKTIRMLCTYFPACRKTILFLKQWLELCNLKSPEGISTYALCWYVIYIMQQREMIIPNIARIIEKGGKYRKIDGWNVGTTSEFSRDFNIDFSDRTVDIVLHFFESYADFPYRSKVVCPLISGSLEKRDFFYREKLPDEMEPYEAYMKNSNDPEPFRIDSPMCIQDPYNLQLNLTKDVKKAYLSRFRELCAKSAKLIRGLSSDESK